MTTAAESAAAAAANAAPTPDKENEDASLSSASLCIKIHMLGQTFGPEFTHQCFPGEFIRGYHPPLRVLKKLEEEKNLTKDARNNEGAEEETKPPMLLHSSHKHHEAASKELSIDITLAPSCEECQVTICTEQKRLPRRHSMRASKRRRLNSDESTLTGSDGAPEAAEEEEELDASEQEDDYVNEDEDDDKDDDDSEFEADAIEVEEEHEEKEGTTRHSRMATKEILESMKKGLPSVADNNKKKVEDVFLRRPVGVELKEYSVKGDDFVLCLASGTEAANYHKTVQPLALWFIETADEVDVASQEGGFWKVLYLFQKHKRTQYSLAGYITLFHFHAPFKKPVPGLVVRICQALVLPPYQRSGHGKQMLTCVFDIAHGQYTEQLQQGTESDDEIVEINVECPAPAFVMLRNRTDYDCFLRSVESNDPWFSSSAKDVTEPDFCTALPECDLMKAAAKAKIIPRQIQIVHELVKLKQLQDYLSSNAAENGGDLERRYRLMIKKRLNKEHRENLSGLRTKGEKLAFLDEEFSKCLESYRKTLPKMKKGV